MKYLLCLLFLTLLGCKVNSSGWPIIWGMHNGTPVQNNIDIKAIKKRDGDRFIGIYSGMIAEWDTKTPRGVMMFSVTSGQLLKWIPANDFTNTFVLKTQPEYK